MKTRENNAGGPKLTRREFFKWVITKQKPPGGRYRDVLEDLARYARFSVYIHGTSLPQATKDEVLKQAAVHLRSSHGAQIGRLALVIPSIPARQLGLTLGTGTDQLIPVGAIAPFAKIGKEGWLESERQAAGVEKGVYASRRRFIGGWLKAAEIGGDVARSVVEGRVNSRQGYVADIAGTIGTPQTVGLGIEVPLKIMPLAFKRRRAEIGGHEQIVASISSLRGNAVRIATDAPIAWFGQVPANVFGATALENLLNQSRFARASQKKAMDAQQKVFEMLPPQHHAHARRILGVK
jgi:hypothetical protein